MSGFEQEGTTCSVTEKRVYGLITLANTLVFLVFLWMFTGHYPTDSNAYNSYALQAESWLQGRLDLGRDYPWLELAIYQDKYYVSFPPFPSCVLLPFAVFFGSDTPDHLILAGVNLLCAFYLYRLGIRLGLSARTAMFETLFVLSGTNMVFLMVDASVWFFAQTLCFLLATAAIYYAVCGRGGISLCCWACAVGCRPMQLLFVPVLLFLLYQREKEAGTDKLLDMIRKRWYWMLPPVLVGGFYMLLNYLRFGNILEFGHNYLPEFVRAEHGQFSLHYFAENLPQLFALPAFDENGRFLVNHFGNLSMLIVSPLFVVFLLLFLVSICGKGGDKPMLEGMTVLLALCYLAILLCHRTLGGWQFGNRYSNDLLPWCYLGVVRMLVRRPKWQAVQIPFFVWGICLNTVGSIFVINGL